MGTTALDRGTTGKLHSKGTIVGLWFGVWLGGAETGCCRSPNGERVNKAEAVGRAGQGEKVERRCWLRVLVG